MKLHYIQTGDVQIKSRQLVSRSPSRAGRALDLLFDPDWSQPLPIGCWLVEHPDGLLLVDTGESPHVSDPGYLPSWHLIMNTCVKLQVSPDEGVGTRIRALGFDPSDVRWVVMTHMHGDHAGGLDQFPNSELIMAHDEAKAALSRLGPVNGYLNMHYPEWLNPSRTSFSNGPWESFDRSTALTRDGSIRLIPTPGHTLGHLSVALEQGDHVVLLGGDAAYNEQALLAGTVDGVAHSSPLHRQTTARLRELCRRRPTVTQFAHDPQSAMRLEARMFTRPMEAAVGDGR